MFAHHMFEYSLAHMTYIYYIYMYIYDTFTCITHFFFIYSSITFFFNRGTLLYTIECVILAHLRKN